MRAKRKPFFVLVALLSAAAILIGASGCALGPQVRITPSAAKSVTTDTFDNGLVSFQIPKGWTVEVGAFDYIHYAFTAYDPQNTDYRLFFMMKAEGFLKTQEMKDWYNRFYHSVMSDLPVVEPQTTEQFFSVLTQALDVDGTGRFFYPRLGTVAKTDSLGTNEIGGEIIRGTCTNENDRKVDGVFTCAIKDVSLYYVTALCVYNIICFTVPDGELPDWEPVLNRCVASIRFSETFTSGFYGQETVLAESIKANAAVYQQTADVISSGWQARQSSYDVISQKQSDATLGYERVYDTETGDIYKADLGFTDHDWNGRYEPVTDEMYLLPTAGYIEKMD